MAMNTLTKTSEILSCCAFNQQVDDLRSIDALEEEISASAVIMLFVSKGYFLSASARRPATPHHALRRRSDALWLTLAHAATQTASAR